MLEAAAFATYFGVMSITPGPNNIMLATSGVNFGFRRTLPHMLGISAGCAVQLLGSTLAFGMLLGWLETVRALLALAGCGYLLWLSWRLLQAGAPGEGQVLRPLGFVSAALFQWVNPKAWVMAINSALLFAPPGGQWWPTVPLLALGAIAVNLPCIALWALGGDRLRGYLQQPRLLRRFNLAMAVLLAATALWLMGSELALLSGLQAWTT